MTSGRPHKRAPEFLCHVKFKNSLPEPVISSRLVNMKPDLSKYIPYRVTGIENEYQYEVPFDILNTSLVDFVDLEKFKPRMNEYLSADDEVFVGNVGGETKGAEKESIIKGHHRPDVTWLRRTEYLAVDATKTKGGKQPGSLTSGQTTSTKTSSKLESKEDVIRFIEESFQYQPDRETLSHPLNPHIKATEIYDIFPDEDELESFAQVTFDADPFATVIDGVEVAKNGDEAALVKAMSNANDPNDTFVWYYLPTNETDRFVYSRDYDIQRIDKGGALTYVFGLPKGEDKKEAIYKPIAGHFSLKKRRAKSDQSRNRHTLIVKRV